MTTSQPYKSERHAGLPNEDRARELDATARDIARVFGRPSVPRTRRPQPGTLARLWRALIAFL